MRMQGKTNVLPATGPVPSLSFFVLRRTATIQRALFASADLIVNSLVLAKSTSSILIDEKHVQTAKA